MSPMPARFESRRRYFDAQNKGTLIDVHASRTTAHKLRFQPDPARSAAYVRRAALKTGVTGVAD